jgi:hypothetical protein
MASAWRQRKEKMARRFFSDDWTRVESEFEESLSDFHAAIASANFPGNGSKKK